MTFIIPQLVQTQAITVTGMSLRTKNADELNHEKAQLPHLWEQFSKSVLQGTQQDGLIYGVYHSYESDLSGYYTVTVGIEIPNEPKAMLMDKVIIKAGSYLVFKAEGTHPSAIINVWQTIWNYFNEKPNYQRAYRTDFELYKTPHESAVYIGIKN